MIPKIIHQIWFGRSIPQLGLKFIERWKNLHPTWEHHLWAKNNLEELNLSQEVFNIVNSNKINPVTISDILRLIILEKYGGVYIDIDMMPIKPIDHFLNRDLLLVYEHDNNSVSGAIIGAIEHHKAIKRMIEIAMENINKVNMQNHINLIGPGMLTAVAKEMNLEILPEVLFHSKTMGNPESYTFHNYFGSKPGGWISWYKKFHALQ